ncbi:hypothetical protein [Micromonospora sp. NPDC006431]|uniref:hypothetical protein n=1 Tax=Micromonospora sp. NPDC006431 TaxID=3364235 RepID=UPI0036C0754C
MLMRLHNLGRSVRCLPAASTGGLALKFASPPWRARCDGLTPAGAGRHKPSAFPSLARARNDEVDMEDRDRLEELRHQAHIMGIKGNARMTEEELRAAVAKVNKGEQPQMPKREAKR